MAFVNVEILCECGIFLKDSRLIALSESGVKPVAIVVECQHNTERKGAKGGKGRSLDSKTWPLVGGGDSPKIPKTTPA